MYVKHKKSGGTYKIVALQIKEDDMGIQVAYQDEMGLVWTRPAAEFFDGRFEAYIPPKVAPDGGLVH